ncbi:MAG: endonuclease/exonuclease/phosphatase family protein, partial [Flavobacteriales bacterium]|nr:endonuclease/exonuclease/phosphatase family protein [Flavobacteriales bacterium]
MKKTFLLALAIIMAMPFSSWAKKPIRVTVLCYNIQTGKRADMDTYVDFIKKYNPDFVAFQELDYMTKRLPRHSDFVGDLAEKTGMYSAYEALMPYSDGQYGIGLMSKYPLEKVRAFTLPEFKDSYERRGALNVVV